MPLQGKALEAIGVMLDERIAAMREALEALDLIRNGYYFRVARSQVMNDKDYEAFDRIYSAAMNLLELAIGLANDFKAKIFASL